VLGNFFSTYAKLRIVNIGKGQSINTNLTLSCYRFEPDMLAFSGCYFGGGEKESMELGEIRRRWKSLHVRPL